MHPGKDHERALLAWVKQQGAGATIDADYAQGFSGTKMDTILEKGFADMMRGVEAQDARNPFPRQPCSCSMTDSGEHGPDCKGRWLRTLNSQNTCYVYVHTVTHEVRGSQPPDYRAPDADNAERQRRNDAALGGRWKDFPSCHLEEWKEAVVGIVGEGKTPLLVADEPQTYTALLSKLSQPGGAELVDTRPFVLPVARTGVKFLDAFATLTSRIGSALKAGRPVVLDLQDFSPHWLDKLCNVPKYRDKFPEQVFNPRALAWQKDYVPAPSPPGFALVLLTTLSPKDYESDIKEKVPWQLVKAVRVTSFIPAQYVLLADLKQALDSALERRRVPLLLDTTPERSADTFLAYQRTQQVDVTQLLSSARTPEEMREVLRAKLVACMKAGDTLMLRLKDSCPDFAGTYCSEDSFPLAAFSFGEVQKEERLQKLFKDEEREHGVCVCRDGFRVVVTSWRPVDSFARDLQAGLPLHRLAVFAVEHEPEDASQ